MKNMHKKHWYICTHIVCSYIKVKLVTKSMNYKVWKFLETCRLACFKQNQTNMSKVASHQSRKIFPLTPNFFVKKWTQNYKTTWSSSSKFHIKLEIYFQMSWSYTTYRNLPLTISFVEYILNFLFKVSPPTCRQRPFYKNVYYISVLG